MAELKHLLGRRIKEIRREKTLNRKNSPKLSGLPQEIVSKLKTVNRTGLQDFYKIFCALND